MIQNMPALLPTVKSPSPIQLWQWITEPLDYMDNSEREYGDIFKIRMSGVLNNCVFLSDPKAIQQVLTGTDKQFAAPGSMNGILKPFLGDRGVILLDGGEHRQRRQLLMPQFHGDKIRVYTELICKLTRDLVAGWQVDETINLREQMQSISLSVILQTVFGLYEGERYEQIQAKLIQVISLTESPVKSSFLFIRKRGKNPALQGGFSGANAVKQYAL